MQVGNTSAAQTRDEFLQLLVAQLRNQDPLEPVKQEDFLAQLAQFSTLEGIEKLNDNFETQMELHQDTMRMDQMSQATSLIGQNVTFVNANKARVTGVVESVQIRSDGFGVVVGDQTIDINDLVQIGARTDDDEAVAASKSTTSSNDTDSKVPVEPVATGFGGASTVLP